MADLNIRLSSEPITQLYISLNDSRKIDNQR